MTSANGRMRSGALWLIFGVGCTLSAWGQVTSRPSVVFPPGPDASNSTNNADRLPPEMRERMEKARADDRMRRLQADADKLLALATTLKADLDKTDKYTLSLDVVRRADEIDRLARTIRDREKQ